MENKYTINQIEILSGIKSHTLRVWEKRYAILEPKRTESNFRYYDENDLKKILNIAFLNNKGYKISKIASLSPEEINTEVFQTYQQKKKNSDTILLLTNALIGYDLHAFKTIFTSYIEQHSFEACIQDLIYPFFENIGIMWQTNKICPAQEHLFSQYIKQKLLAQIDNSKVEATKGKVLLFLRENEYHDLGGLVYHYILQKKGYDVYNLGSSVPIENVFHAIETIQPIYLFTGFTAYMEENDFSLYMKRLIKHTPSTKRFLYGNITFLKDFEKDMDFTLIKNMADLQTKLT